MKRRKLNKRASKRTFNSGLKTEVKNISGRPMRGGIRL